MLKKSRILATFLLLTVGAFACSDSTTGTRGVTDGDPLTEEESAALLVELMEVFEGFGGASPPASPAADIPVNESIDESSSCPGGGSVRLHGNVNGTVDDETFAMDLEFNFTEEITNCGVYHNEMLFVVNGAPNITWAGDYMYSSQSLTGTFSLIGGFSYTAEDDRSGSCGMELNINFTTGVATGSLCDRTFDENVMFQ
jgi:hypothetical protein